MVELVHASVSPFPCISSQSTADESVRMRDTDRCKECVLEIMSRRRIGSGEVSQGAGGGGGKTMEVCIPDQDMQLG